MAINKNAQLTILTPCTSYFSERQSCLGKLQRFPTEIQLSLLPLVELLSLTLFFINDDGIRRICQLINMSHNANLSST